MASKTAFLIASIVIACVCADARVDTQTQSQDVTAALLTEVRALRTTIALAVVPSVRIGNSCDLLARTFLTERANLRVAYTAASF
jgi:hypothetical protein